MTKFREATAHDVQIVDRAIAALRDARTDLADAGCEKAANAVRIALKSAEGAGRHVRNRRERTFSLTGK